MIVNITSDHLDSYENVKHKEKHLDMEYLHAPSKEYLPPSLSDSYEKVTHPEKHSDMEYLQIPMFPNLFLVKD